MSRPIDDNALGSDEPFSGRKRTWSTPHLITSKIDHDTSTGPSPVPHTEIHGPVTSGVHPSS
jgi:hypothetical protein